MPLCYDISLPRYLTVLNNIPLKSLCSMLNLFHHFDLALLAARSETVHASKCSYTLALLRKSEAITQGP